MRLTIFESSKIDCLQARELGFRPFGLLVVLHHQTPGTNGDFFFFFIIFVQINSSKWWRIESETECLRGIWIFHLSSYYTLTRWWHGFSSGIRLHRVDFSKRVMPFNFSSCESKESSMEIYDMHAHILQNIWMSSDMKLKELCSWRVRTACCLFSSCFSKYLAIFAWNLASSTVSSVFFLEQHHSNTHTQR